MLADDISKSNRDLMNTLFVYFPADWFGTDIKHNLNNNIQSPLSEIRDQSG